MAADGGGRASSTVAAVTSVLAWIRDNATVLSLFTSIGTMIVWIFYAHLLLANFLRQRAARIVINRGNDAGLASLLIVGNMGQEPLFVECLTAVLYTTDGRHARQITEGRWSEDPTSADTLGDVTRQGPLQTGEIMNLGSFGTQLRRVTAGTELAAPDENSPPRLESVKTVEIRVIAIYGPETQPVGARRRFRVERTQEEAESRYSFHPVTLHTERFTSRWQRRSVRRWHRDCL